MRKDKSDIETEIERRCQQAAGRIDARLSED